MTQERLIGTITIAGEAINLIETEYGDGSSAVIAQTEAGEPYGTLSVNPGPEAGIEAGVIAVKTWSENASWWQTAAISGLFLLTGRQVRFGDLVAPLWQIWRPVEA
jgi:hypothetical protein